jgi:hypothetical protein
MDKEGFREYLQGRNVSEDIIHQFIPIIEKFDSFLKSNGKGGVDTSTTSEDVLAFSALLIHEKLNTYDNYLAVVRYGQHIKNNKILITAVELIDGSEAMDNLYVRLAAEMGEKKRGEVFAGIELPPVGTPSSQKPKTTQMVMERLQDLVDYETCKKIISPSLRNLDSGAFAGDRKKYLECGNLDAYLVRKGQDFIAELEQLHNEGKLYYTQEITEEVIDFVRNTPLIASGVREGNILYEVKIPFMAKEYLSETDDSLKRYYYCHCPWVRESIRGSDINIPPLFCLCSAGYVKKPWEVVFDQPLEAEAVETVLQGDKWCKIAMQLPEGV